MVLCTKVLAVNLNWNGDEWNFNAYTFDEQNEWNEGNVFVYFPETVYMIKTCLSLSRFLFFTILFRIDIVLPSTKHLANLVKFI